MSDQNPEATEPDAGIFAANQATAQDQINTILDLDTILSSARLIERYEEVCVRGDLVREHDDVIRELSRLVDLDGNLVSEDDGDASLADGAKVEQLQQRAEELREEMKPATLGILFRAMASDEWEAFDKSHKNGSGNYKDRPRFEHELIAKCAVRPEMTPADVAGKLRKNLSQGQFVKLFNAAFYVNVQDGLDVPKLPSYLAAPKPQE